MGQIRGDAGNLALGLRPSPDSPKPAPFHRLRACGPGKTRSPTSAHSASDKASRRFEKRFACGSAGRDVQNLSADSACSQGVKRAFRNSNNPRTGNPALIGLLKGLHMGICPFWQQMCRVYTSHFRRSHKRPATPPPRTPSRLGPPAFARGAWGRIGWEEGMSQSADGPAIFSGGAGLFLGRRRAKRHAGHSVLSMTRSRRPVLNPRNIQFFPGNSRASSEGGGGGGGVRRRSPNCFFFFCEWPSFRPTFSGGHKPCGSPLLREYLALEPGDRRSTRTGGFSPDLWRQLKCREGPGYGGRRLKTNFSKSMARTTAEKLGACARPHSSDARNEHREGRRSA